MKDRYIRNENMLSHEENQSLRKRKVAVVGCGGLGGHIIEMLARLGVGYLTLIDGDVFEASNLNRQLLSLPDNIGKPKTSAAAERVRAVNADIHVNVHQAFVTKDNAKTLLQGHDVICDALDNISGRRVVEQAAEELNIPMVFAAIAGWYAQVGTIMPGSRLLDKIYPPGTNKGAETKLGNPSFTPALAASLQVAECLKLLVNKEGILKNKLLMVDTLEHEYQVIEI